MTRELYYIAVAVVVAAAANAERSLALFAPVEAAPAAASPLRQESGTWTTSCS